MRVIGSEVRVFLAVPEWPEIRHGVRGEPGFTCFKPETSEILYRFGAGGRWQVVHTLVRGSTLERQAANEVLYKFGDHRKTLEIVAAEFRFYPREKPADE